MTEKQKVLNNESIGEFVAIEELQPHPDNPRINDHAVEEIAGSIKRFGFAAPIIARKEDNVIIGGHTRWKAAKSLGLDKVPVRFMDLDPVDAKLLMLADNKLGERADWDEEALQELFNELQEEDLSGLGWDDDELQNILLERAEGKNDAFEEWIDMPEYEMDDLTSFRKIIVHFDNQDQVDQFAALLEQNISDKTKFLWYPKKQKQDNESLRY